MTLHSARSSTYSRRPEYRPQKGQPALRSHRHVHEEVNIGGNIALLQAAIVQAGAEESYPGYCIWRLSKA